MANVYDATIYAKFYNEKQRDDWLMEHGVNQSTLKGGPVTSYSTDYEGGYRDLALSLLQNLVEMRSTYVPNDPYSEPCKSVDGIIKYATCTLKVKS